MSTFVCVCVFAHACVGVWQKTYVCEMCVREATKGPLYSTTTKELGMYYMLAVAMLIVTTIPTFHVTTIPKHLLPNAN